MRRGSVPITCTWMIGVFERYCPAGQHDIWTPSAIISRWSYNGVHCLLETYSYQAVVVGDLPMPEVKHPPFAPASSFNVA